MTQSSGLTTVSAFLAELLVKKENTVRQQLRKWLRDAEDKTKTGRSTLNVTSCFSLLLSSILSLWTETEKASELYRLGSTFTTFNLKE